MNCILVIPVSCAIMTPLPLVVLYIIKLVLERNKKKLATSKEELQNPLQTVSSISTSISSSKLNQLN
jgi:hypothetical protein